MIFSTAGAAIKACHLDAWQIACFRAGIAAVVVAVVVPESRRGWTRRTALVAIAYAATAILFVQANKLTTAASTIFIQAASPLFIAALGPWLIGEWPRRRDLPFMAALLAGLALFVLGAQDGAATAPFPRLGNVIAIASSFTVALMMIGLRWLVSRETNTQVPFWKQVTEQGSTLWYCDVTNSSQRDTPVPVKGSILSDDMGLYEL